MFNKKILFYGMLLLIFIVVDVRNAFAEGNYYRITSENLNMRSGPGTTYSVIKRLTRNENVQKLGQQKLSDGSLWFKIQTSQQKIGWINSKYCVTTDRSSEILPNSSIATRNRASNVFSVVFFTFITLAITYMFKKRKNKLAPIDFLLASLVLCVTFITETFGFSYFNFQNPFLINEAFAAFLVIYALSCFWGAIIERWVMFFYFVFLIPLILTNALHGLDESNCQGTILAFLLSLVLYPLSIQWARNMALRNENSKAASVGFHVLEFVLLSNFFPFFLAITLISALAEYFPQLKPTAYEWLTSQRYHPSPELTAFYLRDALTYLEMYLIIILMYYNTMRQYVWYLPFIGSLLQERGEEEA